MDGFCTQVLAESPSTTLLTHDEAFGALPQAPVPVAVPVPADPWVALENQFLRAECLSLGRKLKRALAKIDDLESSLVEMRGERDGARWVLDAAVDHIKELEGEHAAKKRVVEAVARAVDPSGFDEQ